MALTYAIPCRAGNWGIPSRGINERCQFQSRSSVQTAAPRWAPLLSRWPCGTTGGRDRYTKEGKVTGGQHFHRICNCGHRWAEQCSDQVRDAREL